MRARGTLYCRLLSIRFRHPSVTRAWPAKRTWLKTLKLSARTSLHPRKSHAHDMRHALQNTFPVDCVIYPPSFFAITTFCHCHLPFLISPPIVRAQCWLCRAAPNPHLCNANGDPGLLQPPARLASYCFRPLAAGGSKQVSRPWFRHPFCAPTPTIRSPAGQPRTCR
jgi:hypothetical protein